MEPLVTRRKQSYPSWGGCQGKGSEGTLIWGWSSAGGSRGRDARKYLLRSSICGPEINRRNSAGISAKSKCPLLPSSIHTRGPMQKPAAARRLLSWQQGWGKESGGLQAQAGRQTAAAAAAAARMLCCKAEAELEKRAPTLCSEARGAAHVVNPLCALSCSVIHHPGKRQPFHCWHELFNSFF